MDAVPWWWALLTLIAGFCLGGGTVAVWIYRGQLDAYDSGYRAGSEWAQLDAEDSRG